MIDVVSHNYRSQIVRYVRYEAFIDISVVIELIVSGQSPNGNWT